MIKTIFKIVLTLIAFAIGNVMYHISIPELVTIPEEQWWAEGVVPRVLDHSIHPFKIDVPSSVLEDLSSRLKNARNFTPPLRGIQHEYGTNTNFLNNVVEYWRTKYNWQERQKFLNQYPQFKTQIQGLNIHFIHAKPKNVPINVQVRPLLILHAWPGSVRDYYEMIPMLTTVQPGVDFVFEVIVPSIPGYGFSDAAHLPGLGPSQAAVIFKNLMQRLNIPQFYLHGGDLDITTEMAMFYPKLVRGLHLSLCSSNGPWSTLKTILGSIYPASVVEEKFQKRMYPLSNLFSYYLQEFGYMHVQATKPDTIGVGLNDSPVGLAAYILEKFISWTNMEWISRSGNPVIERFTYDKLLDNVMIYWVTNSITTSMRLYAESFNKRNNVLAKNGPIEIPSACSVFGNDIFYQPKEFFTEKFKNLVQTNEYEGGHFSALEVPESLSKDIWLAVKQFEISHKQTKK